MQMVINIRKKDIMFLLVGLAIFGGVAALYAGTVTIPNTFTAGTTAVADEVNANFTAVKTAVDDNASNITTNTPVGTIVAYGGATYPDGWLMADGSAVSRTTYGDLFTAIGTTYGTGDGSTTFNLPDLKQRFPHG